MGGWLQVGDKTFNDEDHFATISVGFCYRDTMESGSNYPPCKDCAPLWHEPALDVLKNGELTLMVDGYGPTYHLGKTHKKAMIETVRSWHGYGFEVLLTPHPSLRATGSQKKRCSNCDAR